MIPNTFHFVHLTSAERFRSFGLHHALCIISCKAVNNPDSIFLYCNEEPTGEHWERIRGLVTVIMVEPPTEIFGVPITELAHQSDVIRIQALLESGGVYTDMDTLFVRPYHELYQHECVLGHQGKNGSEGICPAVIMAQKGSVFLQNWFANFSTYFKGGAPGTETWCTHSVMLPMMLTQHQAMSGHFHVQPHDSFFYPLYHEAHIKMLFEQNFDFPNAYSFHLWETQSKEYLDRLTEEYIKTTDTTYNVHARKFL